METTRREFIKTSGIITGGALLSTLPFSSYGYHNSADDVIKIALVGCGGRGTGAAVQALSTKFNVKIVALADAFKDRVESAYKSLTAKKYKDDAGNEIDISKKVDVTPERMFVGFDAYKQAMALADVVILATPPGFRPIHFEEAVNQGKQIFMEKPVATDAAGVRRVLAAAEIAKQKKLNVVVGLQRHYQRNYREAMARIHDGKIGDIIGGSVYWVSGGVWNNPRKAGQTEMEYQMRNWYYFNWLCGDHIVEQHIHNIDVANWAKRGYPTEARGTGGREVRNGKEFGEIFDHHIVDFTYADGSMINSQCRHYEGTWSRVDEQFIGTKGRINSFNGDKTIVQSHKGKVIYGHTGSKTDRNPYQVEHDELFEAITKGEYKFADADNGARSTMTAILGRMATYSGKTVKWDEALNSNISLAPDTFAWDALPKLLPNADGFYPVAVPGKTLVV
jgi:myo-inositol 2-dehydrogenase / D-chiro-inositol 1-dehydrogenase